MKRWTKEEDDILMSQKSEEIAELGRSKAALDARKEFLDQLHKDWTPEMDALVLAGQRVPYKSDRVIKARKGILEGTYYKATRDEVTKAVRLYVLTDKSIAEIAEELGEAQSVVRNRIDKALKDYKNEIRVFLKEKTGKDTKTVTRKMIKDYKRGVLVG